MIFKRNELQKDVNIHSNIKHVFCAPGWNTHTRLLLLFMYTYPSLLVENIIADSRQMLISVAAETVYGNISLFFVVVI